MTYRPCFSQLPPVLTVLALALLAPSALAQGSLTPPGAPAPTMHSLQDIWLKVDGVETKGTALQTATSALLQQNALIQSQLTETQSMLRKLLVAMGSLPDATMSTVDATGDVGQYASLAFGPTAQLGIAYYDATNADLKFASFDGVTWQISVVDAAGDVGKGASLAYGADGQPAIAYADSTNNTLLFSRYNGLAWVKQTVDAQPASSPSLKFSPTTGEPAIAYTAGTTVRFARLSGATWQLATLSTGMNYQPSLAFRPDGQPAIAYHTTPAWVMQVTQYSGTTWQSSQPVSGGIHGISPSLAFDPLGHPAATCVDPSNGVLCPRSNGTDWSTTTIGLSSLGMSSATSLAFAGSQMIVAIYNQPLGDLMLARHNGTSWLLDTLDATGDVGKYASLAVRASDSTIGIAYYDVTNGNLKFIRY